MDLIRGAVFDLDDTLYFESMYVRSGFGFVAHTIGDERDTSEAILCFLLHNFESGIRGNSFDRMLLQFPSIAARRSLEDIVQLYRTHAPAIQFMDGVEELLAELTGNGIRLAMITDGPAASQAKKILALGAGKYFDLVFMTDELGLEFRKPHPRAFEQVMARWCFKPEELVYIGDNPKKDFAAPRALGWRTMRLRVKEQQHFALEAESSRFAADREFSSFRDFSHWLRAACGLNPERMEISAK